MGNLEKIVKAEILRLANREIRRVFRPLKKELWAMRGKLSTLSKSVASLNRIAKENPDKVVFCLDSIVCPCSTMYRIHPAYLCWVLEELARGRVVNQVKVDEETAHYARLALERMLSVP